MDKCKEKENGEKKRRNETPLDLDLIHSPLHLSRFHFLPPKTSSSAFSFVANQSIRQKKQKQSHPDAVVVASSSQLLLLLLLLERCADHCAPPTPPGVVALPILVPDLPSRPPAGDGFLNVSVCACVRGWVGGREGGEAERGEEEGKKVRRRESVENDGAPPLPPPPQKKR